MVPRDDNWCSLNASPWLKNGRFRCGKKIRLNQQCFGTSNQKPYGLLKLLNIRECKGSHCCDCPHIAVGIEYLVARKNTNAVQQCAVSQIRWQFFELSFCSNFNVSHFWKPQSHLCSWLEHSWPSDMRQTWPCSRQLCKWAWKPEWLHFMFLFWSWVGFRICHFKRSGHRFSDFWNLFSSLGHQLHFLKFCWLTPWHLCQKFSKILAWHSSLWQLKCQVLKLSRCTNRGWF